MIIVKTAITYILMEAHTCSKAQHFTALHKVRQYSIKRTVLALEEDEEETVKLSFIWSFGELLIVHCTEGQIIIQIRF